MKRIATLIVFGLATMGVSPIAAEDGVTVKGQVVVDQSQMESWNDEKLEINLAELKSRLIENPEMPAAPVPENWSELKPEERFQWIQEFESSDEGKQFVENRKKIFENRRTFDVKIENDGNFVVFDVPPGAYGLQGRIDKKIGDTNYGFEIFGQIDVLKDVDEIELDPIQVAVTPLLEAKQTAPPISVQTYDDKKTLTLDSFKGKYLCICYWITSSPSAEFQSELQEMYAELKTKQPLRLLAICVDEDRKKAIDYIVKQKLREGSHGFTDGLEHQTLFNYGVRSFPSFWLIDPEGKIVMTQFEFAKAFRTESDLGVIITNRILGKDAPTPATPPVQQEDVKEAAGSGS